MDTFIHALPESNWLFQNFEFFLLCMGHSLSDNGPNLHKLAFYKKSQLDYEGQLGL